MHRAGAGAEYPPSTSWGEKEGKLSRRLLIPLLALLAVLGSLTAPSEARHAVAQSDQSTYLVVFKKHRLPGNYESRIGNAGGSVAIAYPEIGVVTAHSANPSFEANLEADKKVFGVTHSPVVDTSEAVGAAALGADPDEDLNDDRFPGIPVTDDDPLSGLQWDMRQIHVPEAHAITGGSPEVLVGDIDTGIDPGHPDLAANIDFESSVSCVGGVPNQDPAAWFDHGGHGTHTAGTIAAAANGVGIVGVAPNVKIAAIKAGNDFGYFFPADVVCAFMWAAEHDVDVTNNSYFADPWLFNCPNDPEQRVILEAEQRAIEFAQDEGVLVVASAGNENYDLARPLTDTISPDWPPGNEAPRPIDNSCFVVPAELDDVVTVSANGNLMQKSYYSTYGLGVVELVAPGGDRRFQVTADAPNGRVLSTFPGALFDPANPLMVQDCSVSPCATYAYLQGTSMAAPHVAGVAALVVSRFGEMDPEKLAEILEDTADAVPCPPNPFNPGPPFDFLATCEGTAQNNGFFGHGQVNAFSAIADGADDGDDDDADDDNGDDDEGGGNREVSRRNRDDD
jgi:subtilisin family serine protease